MLVLLLEVVLHLEEDGVEEVCRCEVDVVGELLVAVVVVPLGGSSPLEFCPCPQPPRLLLLHSRSRHHSSRWRLLLL